MADDVTDNSQSKVWDPNDPANPNYQPPQQAPQVVQSMPDQQLKDNGTDVNVALGMPTAVLPTEQQTMADIQLQNQQGELYAAIKRGDRVRVEELLDRGADVNRPDNSGTTAMMNAVENNDSDISREFVQQKSNGNIAFDPNADQNLTGGVTTKPDGTVDPNAAGTDNASAANVATAVSQGITAEEAEAQGNYALAAQLRAQDNLAQEALEQNDVAASDTSDGDWSYAATVADSYGGYYEDPYADYYGDDDDWYGDDYDMYGYDDYDMYGYDDYGYDDYGYNDYYDDPYDPYSFSSDDYDPYAFGATDNEFSYTDPTDPLNFSLTDPTLTGGTTGTTSNFTFQDPTTSDPFMSSFYPQATDFANSFANYTTPSLTGGTGSTSNFFNMSQPITGTSLDNSTVWNTSFFDPASLQTATTVANDVSNTLTIAPTNPYYKPSAGGASMSM